MFAWRWHQSYMVATMNCLALTGGARGAEHHGAAGRSEHKQFIVATMYDLCPDRLRRVLFQRSSSTSGAARRGAVLVERSTIEDIKKEQKLRKLPLVSSISIENRFVDKCLAGQERAPPSGRPSLRLAWSGSGPTVGPERFHFGNMRCVALKNLAGDSLGLTSPMRSLAHVCDCVNHSRYRVNAGRYDAEQMRIGLWVDRLSIGALFRHMHASCCL
jgi:hypothetical protein